MQQVQQYQGMGVRKLAKVREEPCKKIKGNIADAHTGPRKVALSTSWPGKSHNSWGIGLSTQGVPASGVGQN